MGKALDKTLVSMISAIILFLLFYRVTHSPLLGMFAALLLLSTLWMGWRLLRPKSPKNVLGKRDFIRFVLLKGNDILKKWVELSIGEEYTISEVDGHTLLSGNGERILIYYVYKFGSLSEEDLAKSYRIAEKYHAESIYALTNHIDRKAIAVTEYMPQKVTLVSATVLYKYLMKRNLIPDKSAFALKRKRMGKLIKLAINERNAKYYILAGLSTSLIALFTPFTVYYVSFAFLNLILALSCVIFSERSEGRNELFKG